MEKREGAKKRWDLEKDKRSLWSNTGEAFVQCRQYRAEEKLIAFPYGLRK